MNNSLSDLMSYYSWAKKNSRYRESIGDLFCGFTLYSREDFVFSSPVGDALSILYATPSSAMLFSSIYFLILCFSSLLGS